MKLIYYYDEVRPEQILLAGGKGLNVALIHQAGLLVPRGFILSAEAFRMVVAERGLGDLLAAFLGAETSPDVIAEVCERLKDTVVAVCIEDEIRVPLIQAFEELSPTSPASLIVRSSATVEDSPKASFAGLLSSFPNVRDFDDLLVAVRKCWASIFTPETHIYLKEQGLLGADVGVAVLIQAMVPAERSGIVFSKDPVTGDSDKVVIEAILGFGEEIVSGEVTPERYLYSRKRQMVVSRKLGRQSEFISPTGERKKVFEELELTPRLSEQEVFELAGAGIKLEEIFGSPQDIEWAYSGGKFFILQSRPIVIGERYEKLFPQIGEHTVLLRGSGVSPAMGSGRVKIIKPDEIPETDRNTVIVAKRITNDLAVHLRRAAAVVTDEGGATSHGANILREFNVPCVLATANATEKLKEGQVVTVDGFRGAVYEGDLAVRTNRSADVPDTLTKVFISVLVPEKARNVAPFADGVSSLRNDYFMLESGVHPIKMIKEGLGVYLEESIANGIVQTLQLFKGKPVWYKTMDAPTDEFRRLKGADDPEERNPLFGWRGIGRELEEREMLELEFRAVSRALEINGGDLGIKLPFIRFVDELRAAKEVMRDVGLRPHEDVKVGISVENPATVFTLLDFIDEGIDFISIGMSDLVMCTLALDRESQKVAHIFRPNHAAVLRLLDEVATVAGKHNIFTCVAGESARDPSVLPYLVTAGFEAIGVSPAFFSEVKNEIARIEGELHRGARRVSR
ncbi:MAG: PEP/pyruvate-binding domain-containing protein, partial [Candidatus Aquicultor sp.]|nr:PEP/pyruvate-binding domain-containing protein [Candidatus Aquicultor sp.]